MKRILITALVALAAVAVAGPAGAATGTLFGSATVEADHVKLVSDLSTADTADDFGGVHLTGTGVTTLSSLTNLGAEFNVTDDACLGGSPRFELDFAGTTNNAFVYLGTYNPVTGAYDCAANTWITSGDLTHSTQPVWDTSKFAGGKQYSTAAEAYALLGSQTVEDIRLVTDAGWAFADKEQTVLVRSAQVNTTTFSWQQEQPPTGHVNPAQACAKLRSTMGAAAFAQLYGTNGNHRNAFGKCVSRMARMQGQSVVAATKACKDKTGAEKRACVATTSAASFEAKRQALTAAATTCSSQWKAGKARFAKRYGKGRAHRNAFPTCVAVQLRH